jgi:hypothetical protein
VQRPEQDGETDGGDAEADAELPCADQIGQAARRARSDPVRDQDVRDRLPVRPGHDAAAGGHVQPGLAVVERVVQHVLRIAAQDLRGTA